MSASAAGWPTDVEPYYKELWQDVAWIHTKWLLYLDLFLPRENRDIMHDTVPSTFKVIEDCLRADMTISMGRLIDPPDHGKNRTNLSLPALLEAVKPHVPPALFTSLEQQLQDLRAHCADLLEWRNRRVGRRDRKTAFNTHPQPLKTLTRPYVDTAFTMLREFMNDVEFQFSHAHTAYAHPVQRGSGKDLMFFLKTALNHFEEEERRLRGLLRDEGAG